MVFSAVYAQENNSLTLQELGNGWELLFDGSSLDHWRQYNGESVPDTWTVEDGTVTFTPRETDAAEGSQSIITKKKYQDFHLKLEWKVTEGGNSGVFYGVLEQPGQEIYWSAPEMQLVDNEFYPDTADADDQMAGSLYDLVPAEPQNANPVGQWNSAQIIVEQAHVEHWQNGVKVLSIKRWTPEWFEMIRNSKFECHNEFGNLRRGHIGLQDHGTVLKFRNIKIKSIN